MEKESNVKLEAKKIAKSAIKVNYIILRKKIKNSILNSIPYILVLVLLLYYVLQF